MRLRGNTVAVVIALAIIGVTLTTTRSFADTLGKPLTSDGWTGFFFGASLGLGVGEGTSTQFGSRDSATNNFLNHTASIPPGSPGLVGSFNRNFRQIGPSGGLNAGYNWQVGKYLVVGLVADLQLANIAGRASSVVYEQPAIFGQTFPFIATGESELGWLSTLRARAGFLATSDVLLYGTGGLAFGQISNRGSITLATNFVSSSGSGVGFVCDATSGPVTCFEGRRTGTMWVVGWRRNRTPRFSRLDR